MSQLLHSSERPIPVAVPGGPAEEDVDLRAIATVVRRHWLLVLAGLLLGVGAGWGITRLTDPVYHASATLRIDDDKAGLPGLELLKELGAGESEVSTEMEVLRTRSLAREVIARLGLRVRVESPARVPRSEILAHVTVADSARPARYRLTRRADGAFAVTRLADERLGAERAIGVARDGRLELPGVMLRLAPSAAAHPEIVIAVAGRSETVAAFHRALAVERPTRDASIVVVGYRGTDPELVRDVPNVLAAGFIERRVRVQKTGARSTVGFLQAQVDTLAGQLRRAEDSLRAFREDARVVSLEAEAKVQVERLAELQAQRGELESERSALHRLLDEAERDRRDGVSSPYRRLLAFPTLLRNQAVSSLLGSLVELDNERGALLQRRTVEDPDVVGLTRRIADLEGQIRTMVGTYAAGLDRQVASVDQALAGFGARLSQVPAKEVRFARLQRQATVLGEIFTLLQTRLKEAEIAQAVEDPSAQIVDAADLPELPVAPRGPLNLAIGALVGLAIGLAGAFGRHWLDRAVHTRDDVQETTGLPVLGLIPHIGTGEGPRRRLVGRSRPPAGTALTTVRAPIVLARESLGIVSEAYRSLRTNLTFARAGQPPKTIVFTSPAPGDGKTTSVSNLAATLAQQGLRVLAVDADMRRGLLHLDLGGRRDRGLSDLLTGNLELEQAIQTIELTPTVRVDLIATGPMPPNPAELLGSPQLSRLLARLETLYDVVLIDCAPVNLVTDAAVLGTRADGVVLVTRAAKTLRQELALAVDHLRQVRVTMLGAVLNDFDARRDAAYGSAYYTYGYGRSEAV